MGGNSQDRINDHLYDPHALCFCFLLLPATLIQLQTTTQVIAGKWVGTEEAASGRLVRLFIRAVRDYEALALSELEKDRSESFKNSRRKNKKIIINV